MNALEVAAKVHAGVHDVFLVKGGTTEQWERVAADPRKFNRAWRRVLGLADGETPPPPDWRNIDPSTGELLSVEIWQEEAHSGTPEAKPAHVACIDCEGFKSGCKRGFHPSVTHEPVNLCDRYTAHAGQDGNGHAPNIAEISQQRGIQQLAEWEAQRQQTKSGPPCKLGDRLLKFSARNEAA